jgi:signal transduction histidine kinase
VPHTVHVPTEFERIFAVAEETVAKFFHSRTEEPEHGTIEIFGERYILVRAASLSVEFFGLVERLLGPGREREADEFAQNLLFDLSHALGKSDACNFARKMSLDDPVARLSAGPVHFAHAGWSLVDILPESRPVPGPDYYLIYDHPYSFESDAWLRARKSCDFPACIMNSGYSSGWCEESFGIQLVAYEVRCRAKGDDTCRFIMAPPQKIEEYVRDFAAAHGAPAQFGGRYEIPGFFSRKRAEEELRRLYERLKELDTLKTEFFANVSHELRTPLMLVAGPIERLLADDRLAEDQREDLQLVRRSARQLLERVEELLDVAKLDAGRMAIRCSELDLAELLRLASANFDPLAVERGISYGVEAPGSLQAQVDPDKLGRVIVNLLSNAFKFARSTIRATLREHGGHAILEVADDGEGVPRHMREAVFERFRRLEGEAARRFGGTGLGLAIAKDFVQLHGGRIEVGDAPEGGALFRVEIPTKARTVAPPEGAPPTVKIEAALLAQSPAAPNRIRPAAPHGPVDPNAPRVVVVEDNPDMLRFLADVLCSHYRIDTAMDGREGLDKIRAIRPDLTITDLVMPVLGGEELVRALRSQPDLDTMPILVLTARADDELRVRLLEAGAQDYIAKPFLAGELLARARNLVTAKRAREILQHELASTLGDLEQLAREVSEKRIALQVTLQGMQVARDHAEKAAEAKTRFLSLVSHELRTPLHSLGLNLDWLKRRSEGLSASQIDKLTKIGRASGRLNEMIQELLEFARVESGRLEVHRQDVSLPDVAALVIDDVSPQARHKGLDLRMRVNGEVPVAHTDPKLLRLILVNLVGNAVKFTDAGHVEIVIDHDACGHRVRVIDTGPGIPPEKQEAIFEPFAQLEQHHDKHLAGIGLGLALVRELSRAISGEVSLTSRVGSGSAFSLVLGDSRREKASSTP